MPRADSVLAGVVELGTGVSDALFIATRYLDTRGHRARAWVRCDATMVATTRLMILSSLLLGACAAEPRSISTTPAAPTPPASATAARKSIDPLVAVIDGQTRGFDALRAPLVELGGQTALRDANLDQRLKARLKRDGITIGAEEIERERALLLQTLVTKSDGSAGDNDRAVELLGQIRLKQGLGATRFDALLARNAGLRALVASAVKLDDDGMANTHDMLHGAKRNARLAVLSSLADAERFARDAQTADFTALAVERSLDESAVRGGLLAPISRRDPSYPEPLRAALFATAVGAISTPMLDGARFYVVRVESETAADAISPAQSREYCERMLRISRERLLMDALARELASLEGVTIFDRAFDAPPRAR